MRAGKVLIALLGITALLVNEQERVWLYTPAVSWAGQVDLKPGDVFRDRLQNGSDGPEMVAVPAGRFRMGDIQGVGGKDEQPVHEVVIKRPFVVSRYEITFEQYDEFANATGGTLPDDEGFGRGRHPVIYVSWNDAVAYANWLSQQTSKRYRLPTEAEWEYATRAGTETAWWWGNEMKQGLANCIGCGSQWENKQTAPIGSFRPNPFGLYDTAGNVIEWIQDCWHDNYNGAPVDGSAWEQTGGGDCGRRGLRGGHWRVAQDFMRSSFRMWNRPTVRRRTPGFRLVRELD